jgi:hypothetical protein
MVLMRTSQDGKEWGTHYRYHRLLNPRQTFTSEQNLMLAVLADAINLMLRADPSEHHATAQAWDWILGFGPAGVSFEDACEAVGLDHDALRKSIKRLLRANHTARRSRHEH